MNFLFNFAKAIKNNFNWYLLNSKLKKVKLLVLDVDGVLTNGELLINERGEVIKKFNVKDGLGIKLIKESGIQLALISGADHKSTIFRANQLGIDNYYIGVKDKKKVLRSLKKKLNIDTTQVAYLGDDLNDLVVKNQVGLFFVPKDASKHLIKHADLCLMNKGGEGAVRELCERLLDKKFHKYKNDGWAERNE